MSRDRHADRLHARLAGGAELTADERRHVATCADCQRAVADVDRLDHELRAATAGLAIEPIPDADLEPLAAPDPGWMTSIGVVVAVGLVGIVIGFALGELRPPTGADATPTPPMVAERSATPTPSASPLPSPALIPLADGGRACADGEAGFSIVVPDGWYANLRQDDLMACAFLFPEPFDPALVAGDAPIQLTMSANATPPGTIVDESDGDTWTVERDGEEWRVSVEELRPTTGDEPTYLHLEARAADGAAIAALDAVLDRLAIGDPLEIAPDAVAEADALFADADVCSDLERGVNVILPDAWWTNTMFGDLQPCTYFAPDRFEVGEDDEVPDGVAITLAVVTGDVATVDDILGYETLVVDRHAAERRALAPGLGDPPPNTESYQYIVALDDRSSLLVSLEGERSDDYERDKAILDEMMRRLTISRTPPVLLETGPLPSCGWELVRRTAEGDLHDVESRACLWEAHESSEAAEMVSTGVTVEGAIFREIYRILGSDEIEVIIDWTHDPLSSGGWDVVRCAGLERRDEVDEVTGAILFDPIECDPPEHLEP